MIPKKIHYIWFGDKPIPEEYQGYIEGWKRLCPDYEIIKWDESNFDVHMNGFTEYVYSTKQWAFLCDFARLWIIYTHGGIYLDTDVELLCSPNCILKHSLYMACDVTGRIATGLGFGAEAGHPFLMENMEVYLRLMEGPNDPEIWPCPLYTTPLLAKRGFSFPCVTIRQIDDITVYPAEYFDPYDWTTDKIKKTKNTISIHHYASTWMTAESKQNNIERHHHERLQNKYGSFVADMYGFFFWQRKKHGGPGVIRGIFAALARKLHRSPKNK